MLLIWNVAVKKSSLKINATSLVFFITSSSKFLASDKEYLFHYIWYIL